MTEYQSMVQAAQSAERDLRAHESTTSPDLDGDVFFRDVYCILGLPFDAVTRAQAADRVRNSATSNVRCFLTTPNVNFIVEGIRDPRFREFLLRADLSTIDGMPLVWLARTMGLPIRERAAGSDIFEVLKEPHPQHSELHVFFFGGPANYATAAHSVTNATEGQNLVAVGAISPGYGTVEELSSETFIKRINDSRAGMLIISLGAVKGHRWIQRNLDWLNTPVVCHLGAVVGFASGRLRRAPQWMRDAGLEWLWRIIQEPTLVRRYARDAAALIPILITRVIPYLVWSRMHRTIGSTHPQRILETSIPRGTELKLFGDFTADTLGALRSQLATRFSTPGAMLLDLDGVTYADQAFVGLLQVLKGRCDSGKKELVILCRSQPMLRILRFNCAEYLIEQPSLAGTPWHPSDAEMSSQQNQRA